MRPRHDKRMALTGAAIAAALLLGGCQGGNGASSMASAEGAAGRPVQLFAQPAQPASLAAAPTTATLAEVQRPIDEKSLERAVERHRINLKQQPSPYRSVGLDLNSDGIAEALVLLEGGDWCTNAGCTLAIFSDSPTGFKAMATIRRVWAPVVLASERNNGYSDLVVNTGLAGPREQRVRLRFGADGYPGNAIVQTPMPADIEVGGAVVLAKAPPPAQDLASNTKP